MTDNTMENRIHYAIDDYFADMDHRPSLSAKVLAQTNPNVKVHQKVSLALVFAMLLALLVATALASYFLSGWQIVQDTALPMAQNNDLSDHEEMFSPDELSHILDIAQENNIILTDTIKQAVQGGYGYWEQETIMALACSDFGPYEQWTIQEKYWFEEVMVAIGWKTKNPFCLPQEGDATLEEAFDVAITYVQQKYGDLVSDINRWTYSVFYRNSSDDPQQCMWTFEFRPTTPKDDFYTLTLENDGTIVDCAVIHSDFTSGKAVIEQYEIAYGSYFSWTPEIWFAFGNEIKNASTDSKTVWVFQNTDYILPPANGITQDKAEEIALMANDASYTRIGSVVCCMDGTMPIWKIETQTTYPEDIGSGRFSYVWNIEIDALTGEIVEMRKYEGIRLDFLSRWVPWSVYENLPQMPTSTQ